MVPFHVDNGLYLIITAFPDHGLLVKPSGIDGPGSVLETDSLDMGSIIVLMGRGLTDWLFQDDIIKAKKMFHPVPHAVPALGSSGFKARSVYARMKVAPLEAVPSETSGLTFEEVFFYQGLPDQNQVCATSLGSPYKSLSKQEKNAKKTIRF